MNEKFLRLWETKNKNDEWWSSFVTAPLAIMVNYVVIDLKWLTPNRVTLVSFVTAIASTLFIIAGGTGNFLIAAVLIHASHVFDCMDGQMARYRQTTTPSGSYFDRVTDQIQVTMWFGAVAYAAYVQSLDPLPIFLSFIGVAFYSLRGYAKYVAIHVEASRDRDYLHEKSQQENRDRVPESAGPQFGLGANLRWFAREQYKVFDFDEGVFVFMLSLALVLNQLTPMLWIFAMSQVFYGFYRSWQNGHSIDLNHQPTINK